MIETMNEEARHAAIQAFLTRIDYTEKVIEPLICGEGQVQVDSNAIANMMLHTVLNQLTIMNTLKDMLLKDGETAMRLEENPEQN